MAELYAHDASNADGHDSAVDVSAETDRTLRPVDEHGQESWAEDAEPLTRGEYADQVRQGLVTGEHGNTEQDRDDEHDGAHDQGLAEDGQEQEELPEPRTRQEVAEEASRSDAAVPEHQPADADLEASVVEEDPPPEPRTRQEVAEEARSAPLTPDASTALPEHAPDSTSENPSPDPDQREAYDQGQGDQPYTHLTVVQADATDRTLGDTTPTGIGIKPTGDQLLHLESDDPTENRADRLFGKAFELMDDVHDMTGHIAEAIQEDLPHGSGEPPSAHSAYVVHDQPAPPPDVPGIGDVVGNLTVVGVMTVVGFRRLLSHRMKGHRT